MDMTLETDHNSHTTALEEPAASRSTGTEPDEWRLGEYERVVVEADGFPR